jgi:hypothetical protein
MPTAVTPTAKLATITATAHPFRLLTPLVHTVHTAVLHAVPSGCRRDNSLRWNLPAASLRLLVLVLLAYLRLLPWFLLVMAIRSGW